MTLAAKTSSRARTYHHDIVRKATEASVSGRADSMMTVRVPTAPATCYVREAGIVCHDGTSRRHQLRRLSQRQLTNERSRVCRKWHWAAVVLTQVVRGPDDGDVLEPVGRAAGSRPPLCRHHAVLQPEPLDTQDFPPLGRSSAQARFDRSQPPYSVSILA